MTDNDNQEEPIMRYIAERIAEEIVPILFSIVVIFLMWGIGYIILTDIERTQKDYEICIAAGMEWISGTGCLK